METVKIMELESRNDVIFGIIISLGIIGIISLIIIICHGFISSLNMNDEQFTIDS